jgi:hypothetical protein
MHEYQRRINKSLKLGIISRGTVAHANVVHDSWCGIYKGKYCNCNPQITIECGGTVMEIGEDGLAREVEL